MAEEKDSIKARARAQQDIDDIETLKKSSAFNRYFTRRIGQELKAYGDKVLYDSEDKDSAWEALLKFRELFKISRMLLEDEGACRRMVEQGPPVQEPP